MLCEGCGNPVIDGTCFCGDQAVKELKDKLALAKELVKLLDFKYNYCRNECELFVGDGTHTFYSKKWREEYEAGHYIIKHDEMCKKIQKFLEG